jgi:muramoyltetrapeptide carboxypeptidase
VTNGVFTIGVVAPAARIERTIVEPVQDIATRLFGHGVQLLFHPDSFIGSGHFSADDQTRANAILEYATSDAIDAIWFGRGG